MREEKQGILYMQNLRLSCAAGALIAALGFGTIAAADPMSTPPITAPLAANPEPASFNAGPFGVVNVTGVVSGIGYTQSNRTAADRKSRVDVSNAQIFIQKAEGPVQFFVQAGAYTIPTVGVPYLSAQDTTKATFGLLPQAFVKLVPSENFSIMAGKLPTLIGAEYTYTFQNTNIARGLLWNQENAVNKGVQVNYSTGPASFSVALTDGFYSDRYSVVSALAAFAVNENNILAVAAGANLSDTGIADSNTPLFQNNQDILNVIWTYTNGPLMLSPYFQYTRVSATPKLGITDKGTTTGVALFGKYSWEGGFSMGARAEYIDSKASSTNLLYGGGSKAYSLTLTPTYQQGIYFLRGEVSYVKATDFTPGLAFGVAGTAGSQTRAMIETGVLF
jgi:hypothetical protein